MDIIKEEHKAKARKDHICGHCCSPILKGDYYLDGVYKADEIYHFRRHIVCGSLTETLDMYPLEDLTEDDFYEYVKEAFISIFGDEDFESLPPLEEMANTVYYHQLLKK